MNAPKSKIQVSLSEKEREAFLKISKEQKRNLSQTLSYLCEIYHDLKGSENKEILKIFARVNK